MRWRDIRFEKPTAEDADGNGDVLQLLDNGCIGVYNFRSLFHTLAWMPLSELPKFERVPDLPEPKYRQFNAAEAIKIIGRIVHHKSGSRSMITGVNGIMVWSDGKSMTTQDLLNNYVFDDDGSQCGTEIGPIQDN